MATDKETIDHLAWDTYWKKNPGKALAENTRPDMVIGYVDGWNAAESYYIQKALDSVEKTIDICEKKWNANPAQYTEEDLRSAFDSGRLNQMSFKGYMELFHK